ncbi:MAG: DUF6638 family protein [Pseudomonadota bacterium]
MPDTLTQLMEVSEPHLIERYGRALGAFGLKMPELDSFRIDIIGFSPEVAEALGDQDYLDPKRVNRRFIILSPEQEHLSHIHQSFSNTRDLMLEFFEKNRRVLFALTIKDVIFGEIEDNIFEIDDIDDLLSIEQVEFKIGTHENLTEKTAELKLKIDRLLKEPNAWRDDAMLHDMVDLAKQTGDIRENKLLPEEVVFRHDTFWTSHFGGTYVFHDDNQITVICDPSARGFRRSRPWQVGYLDINDTRTVFDFLLETDRLQPPLGSWIDRSRLLELRRHMAAAWLAEQNDDELPHSIINQTWVRRWTRENTGLVQDNNIIPLIDWADEQAKDWQFNEKDWRKIYVDEVEDDLKFVLCRANPDHPDMALTNRLISRYLPFDFISKFEFNRPNFNRDKQNWSDRYLDFVVNELENTYLGDKESVYESLYL